MSDVTERLRSISNAVDGLRKQVSAQDFHQATTLRLLAELVKVVGELANGTDGPTVAVLTGQEIAKRREAYVQRTIFQACKVPAGTSIEQREQLVLHALRTAGLTDDEIAQWQNE